MARKSANPASCYFYYPHLVCVVGVRDEARGTTNFAPVTWATPLSSDPPLYGVCVSPTTHTYQLVLKTGEFTVNFLPAAERSLVDRLGSISGRDVDKVKTLALALEPAQALATPALATAYAFAECLLLDRHQVGDQTLFVAEVQRIHALNDAFDATGVLRLDRVAPLLYLGNKRYVSTDPGSLVLPRPTQPPTG